MTENFWYNSHSLKEYETICTSLQSYDTNNTNIIMCKYIFLSQKLTPPVFCRKREYITDRDIWTLFKYALSESPTTDNMLFGFFLTLQWRQCTGSNFGDKITANDGNADYLNKFVEMKIDCLEMKIDCLAKFTDWATDHSFPVYHGNLPLNFRIFKGF